MTLGIKPDVIKENVDGSKITNIALFGVDRRAKNEPSTFRFYNYTFYR